MCALAAHLVDGVLGGLPVRQWVLTLPYRLRYRLAYDHRLCRAVLAVFVRALLAFERRRAREQGIDGCGGAVTAIQRCGSALNTNIHFHTLVAEGRPRAGHLVMRIGSDPNAVITRGGPRHAHLEGFDLHANVAVPAGNRTRLEHLCRYVLRPPVAQDALELTPEGKVLLRLRRPWRDGTRAIRFEPGELLEKLAAMVPRPPVLRSSLATEGGRSKLLIYHGAFAPRGRCREGTDPWPWADPESWNPAPGPEAAVPTAEPATEATTDHLPSTHPPGEAPGGAPAEARAPPAQAAYVRPRHFPWADLLRRTFEIDILACPDCGNRLRLVATIENRAVIERILAHLGLPVDVPTPAPARSTEWLPGVLSGPEADSQEWFD